MTNCRMTRSRASDRHCTGTIITDWSHEVGGEVVAGRKRVRLDVPVSVWDIVGEMPVVSPLSHSKFVLKAAYL
jgi:hypothetical protein